jgi:hypothetical protein
MQLAELGTMYTPMSYAKNGMIFFHSSTLLKVLSLFESCTKNVVGDTNETNVIISMVSLLKYIREVAVWYMAHRL